MIAADRFVQQGEVALVTCDDDQADWFRSQRHTFDISVACPDPDCPHCTAGGPMFRHRVHVIDVLPMFEWSHPLNPSMTFPCLIRMPKGYWLTAQTEAFSDGFHITLPPDAAPSKHLVRLAVHA